MTDIEIAKGANLINIEEVAKKLNIDEKFVELYGKNKAKIDLKLFDELNNEKDGKLILVTSINPTPLGEGKTTTSIGLADGLNRIGKKTIVALREPSLGPVFGIKGGATGGGYSQVLPMEEINLHFTGDIHAITTANNLLSALIDNHIFQGNELKIKKVAWRRAIDLNDRMLRKIKIGQSNEKNMFEREDYFDISAASEIMAILCLSQSIDELKTRIDNVLIGYDENDNPVYCRQLGVTGSLVVVLKDALKPNLVQTIENNPCLIHGGPFANIAHGSNTIIATKMGLKLADFLVTEAGFGSDLGAEKFLNIKCQNFGLKPSVVVIVATIKALKYHGGQKISEIFEENEANLRNGIKNLVKHIENIKKYGIEPIVAINKFKQDTDLEINILMEEVKRYADIELITNYTDGSKGSENLAKKVVELADKESKFTPIYNFDAELEVKMDKIAKEIYGANKVVYSENARKKLEKIKKITNNSKGYAICVAKTPYSFSDDSKKK